MKLLLLAAVLQIPLYGEGRPLHDSDSLLRTAVSLLESNQLDSAFRIIKFTLDYVREGNDYNLMAQSFNNLGLYYYKKAKYDSAIFNYRTSLELAQRAQDSVTTAISYKNLGLAYLRLGQYSRAEEANLAALEIFKKIRSLTEIASTNNSIGLILNEVGKYSKAIEYLKQAYESWRAKDDQRRMAIAANNIGNAFHGLKKYDSALHYYHHSSNLGNAIGFQYSLPLNNIGETYLLRKQYDSASHYLRGSLKIKTRNNNQGGIAYTSNVLGDLFMQTKKYKQAKHYLDTAESLAREIGSRSILMKNLRLQRELLRNTGQYRRALEIDSEYDILKDSIYNEEKLKVLELQSKHELEQKDSEKQLAERQAALAKQEKEAEERRARITLIMSGVLAFFLITTLFFLYLIYQQRRKLARLNRSLQVKNHKISLLSQQNFHFTKNSLSEIVSMLNLQTARLGKGAGRDLLVAEKFRIETVVLLYKQLFSESHEEATEMINMHSFLPDVVNNTLDAILPKDVQVSRDLQIEPVSLSNDHALNIGLIVNEISLNACKYAYCHGKAGKFTVRLTTSNHSYELVLKDTGEGLPEDLDWKSTKSFGMRLIRSLADDMDAKVTVNSAKSGLSYYFRIPFIVGT